MKEEEVKGIPWSLMILILGMLGALSFLVYEGKLDSTLLTALVSAITGGGLLHQGWASGASAALAPPPTAPVVAPEVTPEPVAPVATE